MFSHACVMVGVRFDGRISLKLATSEVAMGYIYVESAISARQRGWGAVLRDDAESAWGVVEVQGSSSASTDSRGSESQLGRGRLRGC